MRYTVGRCCPERCTATGGVGAVRRHMGSKTHVERARGSARHVADEPADLCVGSAYEQRVENCRKSIRAIWPSQSCAAVPRRPLRLLLGVLRGSFRKHQYDKDDKCVVLP